jgi:hypothetical protein
VLVVMMLGWTALAYWVGLPIALLTLLVGVSLLRGGRSLAKSATRTENETMRQAVLAMAAHKGAVTARDAAQALGMGVAEADALLTQLAKSEPERVGVDVDDEGNVWYRVASRPGEALPGIPRVRVGEGPRVADADEAAPSATGEETEAARKRAGS